MIHRAPFGSLERFIGILIEHYAGAFPLWLSPTQAAVLPVSEKFREYADSVVQTLRDAGIRVSLDASPEKIGAKIRKAQLAKTPYMLVVGGREAESASVSVRHRSAGDGGVMSVSAVAAGLRKEIDSKARTPVAMERTG
jgi:threonyl-tRNA synthetase